MARKRKPENETSKQEHERKIFEKVSNIANRSEKTSWSRKMDNMVKLLAKMRPVEQKILDIIEKEKIPIQDEIHQLRSVMVKECIHPYEYLVLEEDGSVRCKFCEKKLGIPTDVSEES